LNVRTYVSVGGKPGVWFLSPDGSIWRNDVQHQQWPLQAARVTFDRNSMLDFHGVVVREPPALLHFAKRLDVVVWSAERAA
jgi:uncharacterized protein YqjF (DUF2071 family)